jgi:hypothetical protein
VPQSRVRSGSYYVPRTTHNVVIAQSTPCCKGIISARRTSISVVYLTFFIAKGKSFQIAPSAKLASRVGALLECGEVILSAADSSRITANRKLGRSPYVHSAWPTSWE